MASKEDDKVALGYKSKIKKKMDKVRQVWVGMTSRQLYFLKLAMTHSKCHLIY